MRALLTGGIKAILAIAALSTAAHWALRVQRDAPTSAPAMASLPEPATTGSIEPRRIDQTVRGLEAKGPDPRPPEARAAKAPPSAGLDQMHLSALIAGAAKPAARAESRPAVKAEAKPASKPAPRPVAKAEPKPEAKPAARPEVKPAKVAEAKPVARPEKVDAKR